MMAPGVSSQTYTGDSEKRNRLFFHNIVLEMMIDASDGFFGDRLLLPLVNRQ